MFHALAQMEYTNIARSGINIYKYHKTRYFMLCHKSIIKISQDQIFHGLSQMEYTNITRPDIPCSGTNGIYKYHKTRYSMLWHKWNIQISQDQIFHALAQMEYTNITRPDIPCSGTTGIFTKYHKTRHSVMSVYRNIKGEDTDRTVTNKLQLLSQVTKYSYEKPTNLIDFLVRNIIIRNKQKCYGRHKTSTSMCD